MSNLAQTHQLRMSEISFYLCWPVYLMLMMTVYTIHSSRVSLYKYKVASLSQTIATTVWLGNPPLQRTFFHWNEIVLKCSFVWIMAWTALKIFMYGFGFFLFSNAKCLLKIGIIENFIQHCDHYRHNIGRYWTYRSNILFWNNFIKELDAVRCNYQFFNRDNWDHSHL